MWSSLSGQGKINWEDKCDLDCTGEQAMVVRRSMKEERKKKIKEKKMI